MDASVEHEVAPAQEDASARFAGAGPVSAVVASAALAACGGGGGESSGTGAAPGGGTPPTTAPSDTEASRFLAQASMGATRADIVRVQAIGYAAWIDEQIAIAPSATRWDALVAGGFADASFKNGEGGFDACAWRKLIASPDTLRQRVTLALSELMVASIDSLTGGGWKAFAAANYLDLLEANAFGNYRALMQAVSTNTAMGMYLTFRGSMKANPVTGSLPDENYARELMQLFTIGLVQLDPDGSVRLVGGQPVPTYALADITGLARVFTGCDFDLQGQSGASAGDARLHAPADGADREPPRDRRLDVPRHDHPGEHRRRAEPGHRARHDLRPCQRRPVRVEAADPASRREQPEPGLRRPRRRRLQQRRGRRQGQPQRGGQGDPARRRSAQRRRRRGRVGRQAARAHAALHRLGARLERRLGERRLADRRHLRRGDTARPEPVALALGVQLLPPRLRAAEQRDRRGVAGRARVPDQQRIDRRRRGQLPAARRLGRRRRRRRGDYQPLLALADDAAALVAEINLVLAAGQLSAATAATISTAVATIAGGTDANRLKRIYASLTLVMAAPEFVVLK